jgi:ADP-ribose pyrophosphatase YjhB (NUDIX family)
MPNRIAPFSKEAFEMAKKTKGWVPGADGFTYGNSKLMAHLQHVMHVNEKGDPLYDQYVISQAGGGVFLLIDQENRIGLQEMWRMQCADPEAWTKEYPKVDWEKVGRVSYELCGGFAKVGESGSITALRETQEETGSAVVSQEFLGHVVADKAFCSQLVTVAFGRIDPSKKPADKPDPNEAMLAKVKFFTWSEVAALQREGKLYDSFTLSAIAMLIMKRPEILGMRTPTIIHE